MVVQEPLYACARARMHICLHEERRKEKGEKKHSEHNIINASFIITH